VKRSLVAGSIVVVGLLALGPPPAAAHCDTLDGPVIEDARVALEARDVTPVLKWVAPAEEPELREAFGHALEVRGLGPEARALADRFFFETLVRLHRQGEGEPYTGLKPAGTRLDPGIAAADEALDTGSVEALATLLAKEIDRGVRQRYARAVETRRHAGDSIERGREYVAAYVDFMHYAERLLADAASDTGRREHEEHGRANHVNGPE